jgi:predicted DNA binding CopG/RHH family protein
VDIRQQLAVAQGFDWDEFWSQTDSVDYIDWSKAETITLAELKPTLKTISLRLPVSLIAELKLLANKRDVPYQSLLKTYLADRVREELAQSSLSVHA